MSYNFKDLTSNLKEEFYSENQDTPIFAKSVIYKQFNPSELANGLSNIHAIMIADILVNENMSKDIGHFSSISSFPNIRALTKPTVKCIEHLSDVLLERVNLLTVAALSGGSVFDLGFRIDADWNMPNALNEYLKDSDGLNLLEHLQQFAYQNKKLFDTIMLSSRTLIRLSNDLNVSVPRSELIKLLANYLDLTVMVYDERYIGESGFATRYLPENKVVFMNWAGYTLGESFAFALTPQTEDIIFELLNLEYSSNYGPVAYATAIKETNLEYLTIWANISGFPVRIDPNCSACITLV